MRVDEAKLRRKLGAALDALASWLTARAIEELSPRRFTGAAINSIGHRKVEWHTVEWGADRRVAPHVVYLELGFRPHWVPFRHASMEVWARRVAPHLQANGGVFVGGPNSVLKSSVSGAAGYYPGPGGIRWRTWYTQGGTSRYLPDGKVGWPFLLPALEELSRRKAEVAVIMRDAARRVP